jgi:type I restriction enzyme S subunit
MRSVHEICERVSVGIVIKPSQYYVNDGNGVKAFRSANIGEGYVRDGNWVTISAQGHKANRKSELQNGDVLVVRSGVNRGQSCVVPPHLDGTNCIDIVFARTRKDLVLPEFLSEFTNSSIGKQQVNRAESGLAQPHFNVTAFSNVDIPLPPIPEQEKITQIALVWDRAIDLTEQLIAEKKARRKGLMQQLLTGKRRLPGFDGEWRQVRLSRLFKPVRRKNTVGETMVLTASGEHGLVDQTTYFNRNVSGLDLSGYFLLRRGEFAYNRSSMNGYPYGAIKRLEKHDAGVLSTLYICFALSGEACCPDFFTHLFEACILNKQLRGIVQVGARAHGLLNVGIHDFFTIKTSCPALEEQKAIAAVLNCADRELDLLHAKADSLREQKKGLMQQLLTGKKRVKGEK